MLTIGDNYIVFTLGLEEDMITSEHTSNKEDEEYNNLINLKIFSGNIRHGQLSFNPRQSPIIIGRSPDCDVIIEDSMLSRFHCTVEFNENKNKWFILDGIYDKDKNRIKNSTNGSWKYAFEDTLITNGMCFKANHNLFICSFSWNALYSIIFIHMIIIIKRELQFMTIFINISFCNEKHNNI